MNFCKMSRFKLRFKSKISNLITKNKKEKNKKLLDRKNKSQPKMKTNLNKKHF